MTGADTPLRLAVLLSGSGSNLQAILNATTSGVLRARVTGVFSDRRGAFGLERARQAGIESCALGSGAFASRSDYEAALAARVDGCRPDLVVLAGFMRILGGAFVRHYWGRMLNIHPSLLPKYRGLNTYARVLEAGDSYHGSSVHYVTEELDGGPVVAQARVVVRAGDDASSLSARVQAAEHRLYPEVIGWIADGRLTLTDDRPWLDEQPVLTPIIREYPH